MMASDSENTINETVNELERLSVTMIPSERRRLRPNRHRRPRPPSLIKWYYPDARRIFEVVTAIDMTARTHLLQSSRVTSSWALIAKIYYSIIVQLAILMIRIEMNIENDDERYYYNQIVNTHRPEKLPISKAVAEAILEALPYHSNQQTGFKILPVTSTYPDVKLGFHDVDKYHIEKVDIPATNMFTPNPVIPVMIMRWIRESSDNSDLPTNPTYSHKLMYLLTGRIVTEDYLLEQEIPGTSSPLEMFLMDPAMSLSSAIEIGSKGINKDMIADSVRSAPIEMIPPLPASEILSRNSTELGLYRLTELIKSSWFDQAKGIISVQATVADSLATLSEAVQPLYPEDGIDEPLLYELPANQMDVEHAQLRCDFWM